MKGTSSVSVTHHVLVRTANVGSHDLEDHAVVAFALLLWQLKLWVR